MSTATKRIKLNTIKPARGAKTERKRLGRGGGSGLGKTAGKGHKGQTARAGGYHKLGFEGGQMPLQRRVPKFGFTPITRNTVGIRLSEIAKISDKIIDKNVLLAKGLIPKSAQRIKIYLSGKIEKAVHIKGLLPTKGAREAILAAGGKVED